MFEMFFLAVKLNITCRAHKYKYVVLNLSYKGQKWTITAYNAGVTPPKSDVRVVAVTFYKFYSIIL